MSLETQVGAKKEATYGTPEVVTRFFDFIKEGIKAKRGRIESAGRRAGQRVTRSTDWVPTNMGAAGPLEFEVRAKNFGFWLEHMLGAVSSAGPVDSRHTHTGTVGELFGKSFTLQVNRPFHPSGTSQPFTYHGGKVASWTLKNSVNGLLVAALDLDFEDEDTTTALAVASYPSPNELFSFVGATVTIGGVAYEATEIEFGVNNGLKTDRHYLRGTSLKREPVGAGRRVVTFNLGGGDFADLVQYNRGRSDTVAGALAAVVATWKAPTLVGAAVFPELVVTLPAARFDPETPTEESEAPLAQMLGGVGLWDATNSPITIDYKTADATP